MDCTAELQDAKNRRFIGSLPPMMISPSRREGLLWWGTAEDRASFVKQHNRAGLVFVGLAALCMLASSLVPTKARPAPAPAHMEDAGRILSVELHETAFSTTSSVRTERGTYQVSGAVSWAHGDQATLREDQQGLHARVKDLCLASQIHSSCFRLR